MFMYSGRITVGDVVEERMGRWMLAFLLGAAMLLAPAAMAAACAPVPVAEQTAGHCAQGSDKDRHVPAKQPQCSGICAYAVAVDVNPLAEPRAARPAPTPVPPALLLAGILLERDTPPPRLS